jgi:hypothetical protein
MSSRGFTPPPEANVVEDGEPDTKDDEFARDDAPEQEWEDDSDG